MDIHSHEVHFTLAIPTDVDPVQFVSDAQYQLDANWGEGKVHSIENYTRDGRTLKEVVTAHNYRCTDLENTQYEIRHLEQFLRKGTFKITRTKVEVEPWNPVSKQQELPSVYWEAHVKVWHLAHFEDAWKLGFHVSKVGDGPELTLTMRSVTETRSEFEIRLQIALCYLMNSGVLVGGADVEYCLFDDNPKADNEWLKT